MTTTDNSQIQLADICLVYLQQEDAYLDTLRQSLKDIRKTLLAREMSALNERLQDLIAERPHELNDLQSSLRARLAPLVGKQPEEIQLEDVATFITSAPKEQIDDLIRSMRRKRHEISLLNGSNMAIAAALSRMIDRFIQGATGVPTISTYGSDGKVAQTGHGQIEQQLEV